MSEQEQKSGNAGGSPVVLVEQSGASRHKKLFTPTDLQEEASELHHKRSRAPAVPSAVEEELKDKTNIDTKEPTECEHAMSLEKQKHHIAKKLSSSTKKRASSPESITLEPLEIAKKKGSMTRPPQPIPDISTSDIDVDAKLSAEQEEQDSVNDEIAELRTPELANKNSEWSDEEEAGGLPRSESRASRVSRVVRQLFCCGVRLEAPSEHDISPREFSAI